MTLDELAEAVWERLNAQKTRALLVGEPPKDCHSYIYVKSEPYEAVILGQLPPAALLHMPDDTVCTALLSGMPVYLTVQRFPGKRGVLLRRELTQAQERLLRLGVRKWEEHP